MRAARIEHFGGPDVLRVANVEPPALRPGQVRVDVVGSSVNPVDIAVRNGWMAEFLPLAPPLTLGTDIAGIVAEVAGDVGHLAVGDAVYGVAGVLTGGSGGFAEQAVAGADRLAVAPTVLDLVTAATLPLAGVSALQAITERLVVAPGSRVLVHGAAGGVGLAAVALARHLGGHVVATARGAGVPMAHRFGADEVVDTGSADLATVPPADLTLDLVGSDPVLPVTLTRPGGRVLSLRVMPDQEAAAQRGVEASMQTTEITTQRLNRLRDYVELGVVSPLVARTADLARIAEAIALKEAGGVPGKIAIRVR